MSVSKDKTPRAGGALLAAAIIAGAIGGTIAGRPSVGLVVGLAAGLVMVAVVWFAERPKRPDVESGADDQPQ